MMSQTCFKNETTNPITVSWCTNAEHPDCAEHVWNTQTIGAAGLLTIDAIAANAGEIEGILKDASLTKEVG